MNGWVFSGGGAMTAAVKRNENVQEIRRTPGMIQIIIICFFIIPPFRHPHLFCYFALAVDVDASIASVRFFSSSLCRH